MIYRNQRRYIFKMDLKKKKDRNELWKIILGYFIGFLIIGIIFEGLWEINWKISFIIWLIVSIGDIITFRWILRFVIRIFI